MPQDEPRRRLYGRRLGRPLRTGLKRLIETRLPAISLQLPPLGSELDPGQLFPEPPRDLWLEIGFGGGEHLASQAESHPEVGFIGAEVFLNGVASLLRELETRRLGNVRVLRDDARLLLTALPEAAQTIFICFGAF